MRIPEVFRAPESSLRLQWSRPIDDALVALERQFDQPGKMVPARFNIGSLRLDGRVEGSAVTIAVSSVVAGQRIGGRLPVLYPPNLWLEGEVRATSQGSEFVGSLVATYPLRIAVSFFAVGAAAVLWGALPWPLVLVSVPVVAASAALLFPHQQRRLLREAGSLADFLTITVEGQREPGVRPGASSTRPGALW